MRAGATCSTSKFQRPHLKAPNAIRRVGDTARRVDFADAAKLALGELLLSPLPAHVTNDGPRSVIFGSGVEDGSALKLSHLHVESGARHVRDVGRCPAATEAHDVLEELHLSRIHHLRTRFVIAEQQVALGILAVRWREKSPLGVSQKQHMC